MYGRVVHHVGRDREGAERLAAPADGQAMHAQAQLTAIVRQRGLPTGDPGAALLELRQRLGTEFLRRFKACRVQRLRRGRGQVQAHAAFLWDAFLAAHQPIGLQLKGQRPTVREAKVSCHRHGHRQQHTAFVAVVGQAANREFFGQRPSDRASLQACRQLPLQLGGQARIARVLPIGVPLGLVLDLQAQPEGFSGLDALGGVQLQLGPHLRGVDHMGGTAEQGVGG